MPFLVKYLWLIPALPLLAAAVLAVTRGNNRRFAAPLAVGSLGIGFVLSLGALLWVLGEPGRRAEFNFDWLSIGDQAVQLGWVLDPLTASMLAMVTLVGALIFVFSIGYMEHDANFTRFFCFLALFAAAMLGLIIANSLLLLFMCWEVVGLASYLLIGFWYQKPAAAAAAKKAFITTRIGDLGFLIGMVWLYAETGTLLFYDEGRGVLEQSQVTALVTSTIGGGMIVSTAISLLIFCGAVGKSGQFPLHVWLPDAMEGPTPVSALIHAATMVAAGVFLMARVYPLVSAVPPDAEQLISAARQVITWVGALTAVFAALIAVAQTDIKRILAYSTVSQLGYMFIGLGTGGVGVAMFHLITHAFFKALLFLGAGSIIHGCHHQQDIRRMGGVAKHMPVTFLTYMVGTLALCGFPLFFSGFWSKDEILHSAWSWPVSQLPFYLALFGAGLTAFYMTRQLFYVFSGDYRGSNDSDGATHEPHESPPVMVKPLIVLAVFAVLLGFLGTPLYPWVLAFWEGVTAEFSFGHFAHAIPMMLASTLVVFVGVFFGWWFYGLVARKQVDEPDPLAELNAEYFGWLRNRFYIDELYQRSVIPWNHAFARACDRLDRSVLDLAVHFVSLLTNALAWLARLADEFVVNLGFKLGCDGLVDGGRRFGRLQSGRLSAYLSVIGGALIVLFLLLMMGGGR